MEVMALLLSFPASAALETWDGNNHEAWRVVDYPAGKDRPFF
jgi:hypothetical protein